MFRDIRIPVIPLEHQAGLPAGILFQPDAIGGSLGFGAGARPSDMWDQIEAEAARPPAPGGGPGGDTNLRQVLNNFLFQATTVSDLVIPYNPTRTYLFVQNKGTASIFLGFGRDADVNSGLEIPSGPGFFEPILGTVSSVHCVAAGGVQSVTVIEGFRAA